MWKLDIFPDTGLSESVVTTVWVGVWVISLLNLRFGWTYSGLVIPGYIVPLLIIKPWSALVVGLEGVITYLIVWAFSEKCSESGWWSNLFGRDRFLALVLVSICVRILFDGYLLPLFCDLAELFIPLRIDFRLSLHSFGLIIVSLIANQFWKPGLRRGIAPFAVTLAATFLLVQYVLIPFTNFSISKLEFMYEDISASLLASPKAYIILITTAFMASRMNLHYAWDYNGILIPSLLALQWYEPLKIATSFIEAFAIYFIGSLCLRLPVLKDSTIEGARKLLLFFSISFIYKLIIGHVCDWFHVQVRVSDLYGFGYLLPTLMAVKMHDKGIMARLTRATLQTSLTAAGTASVIGFVLTLIPVGFSESHADLSISEVPERAWSLREEVQRVKENAYSPTVSRRAELPLPRELAAFSEGLDRLKSYLAGRSHVELDRARKAFGATNYEVLLLEDRYIVVREKPPERGWGFYCFDLMAKDGLVIEVPRPLAEWGTLESAAYLMSYLDGGALAVSTAEQGNNAHGRRESLVAFRTMLGAFHRRWDPRNILQVRGYTVGSVRGLYGRRVEVDDLGTLDIPSSLWIKRSIPSGLTIRGVENVVRELTVEWREPSWRNPLRERSHAGFAELYLHRSDRRRLLARYHVGVERVGTLDRYRASEGYLWREVLSTRSDRSGWRSEAIEAPSVEMLLFFDQEIVGPLASLVQRTSRGEISSEEVSEELITIGAAATPVGYAVQKFTDVSDGSEFLILYEREDDAWRGWGTYVFRLGESSDFSVHVPKPSSEKGTLEFSLALFHRLNASFLLISGSDGGSDGRERVDVSKERLTLFNLTHQVILRTLNVHRHLAVQVRAFSYRNVPSSVPADCLLGFAPGAANGGGVGRLGLRLLEQLESQGRRVRVISGEEETLGYDARSSVQSGYLTSTKEKEFAVLWLSPLLRSAFPAATTLQRQTEQFEAVGIPTEIGDLEEIIAAYEVDQSPDGVPKRLLEIVGAYQRTQNLNCLVALIELWPDFSFRRVVDSRSGGAFVLVAVDGKLLPRVLSLSLTLDGGAPGLLETVTLHDQKWAWSSSPRGFLLEKRDDED